MEVRRTGILRLMCSLELIHCSRCQDDDTDRETPLELIEPLTSHGSDVSMDEA